MKEDKEGDVHNSLLELSKEIVMQSKPNAVFWATPEFVSNLEQVSKWLVNEKTKPGLMLGGLFGNGKTVTLTAIKELFHRCVLNPENHHVFFYSSMMKRAKPLLENVMKEELFMEDAMEVDWLLIDELGEEPTLMKNYGNSKTPIIDILNYRYDKCMPTIVTTNLNGDELEEKYTRRVKDRFKDMFDNVIYKAESFRGL